ncbi:high mobility group box domain-containing protein, partial [Gongronella butleri]
MAPVNHSNADSSKDKKVPRPMNCFIIFRREKQREILSKCPGLNHRVLSKIISRLWRALPEEMKKVYKLKARKQKEEHQQQYPGYKYAPAPRRSTARRKYT